MQQSNALSADRQTKSPATAIIGRIHTPIKPEADSRRALYSIRCRMIFIGPSGRPGKLLGVALHLKSEKIAFKIRKNQSV